MRVLHRQGLYFLLITSPLLLGSNRPLIWGLNGIAASIIIIGFVWSEVKRGDSGRLDWNLVALALSGMLAVSIWIAVQATSWTLKGLHHPIWFIDPLLANTASAISANPSQSWKILGWWSTLAVFVIAVRMGTNSNRSYFLLKLMLGTCLLVAVWGFVVEYFELNTLGLMPKRFYKGWLSGTFVNRNTAASFLGIGMVIAVALASHEYAARKAQGTIGSFDVADLVIGRTGIYSAVAGILFFAVLLTGSRGGTGAAIIGGTLVLLLRITKQRRPTTASVMALLSGLIISTALAAASLRGRTDAAESTTVRVSLYTESLKAIADRPLLGHGAGTFSSIEPVYHSPNTPSEFVWDHAHSTMLEALLTVGIPIVISALAVLAYVFYRLIQAWQGADREATAIVASLSAAAGLGIHSFVEFSLEVQAVALYIVCLIGLAIGEAMTLLAAHKRKEHGYGSVK